MSKRKLTLLLHDPFVSILGGIFLATIPFITIISLSRADWLMTIGYVLFFLISFIGVIVTSLTDVNRIIKKENEEMLRALRGDQ